MDDLELNARIFIMGLYLRNCVRDVSMPRPDELERCSEVANQRCRNLHVAFKLQKKAGTKS